LKDPKKRFQGVKTGQTPNAGSCLCSLYVDQKMGYRLMCVVIGTQSNKHRNHETTRLINWCISTKFLKNTKPNKIMVIKKDKK
jgi:D-alanyl-D-alanine carboxypeptidase